MSRTSSADACPIEVSLKEARRIALAAQGFGKPRLDGGAFQRGHLGRLLKRTGLLQIDFVSVLVRAHYMPLFSRLGAYPVDVLDEAAWGAKRTLFEYWAHEASLLPLDLHPLLRWRMARAAAGQGVYGRLGTIARERPEFVAATLAAVKDRGPLAASDFEGSKGNGSWWGWSDTKCALEYCSGPGCSRPGRAVASSGYTICRNERCRAGYWICRRPMRRMRAGSYWTFRPVPMASAPPATCAITSAGCRK